MTNEEAFKIAYESVTAKTWIPTEFAFNQSLKVVWFETRLAQAFNYWIHTDQISMNKEIPKSIKELKKVEKEMESWRKNYDRTSNI